MISVHAVSVLADSVYSMLLLPLALLLLRSPKSEVTQEVHESNFSFNFLLRYQR